MTAPHDLIVFGEDWGRHPSSTQHLIARLPQDWQVCWVNSIGLRRPRLSLRDLKRLATKVMALMRSSNRDDGQVPRPDHIHVHAPMAVPWPASQAAQSLNRRLLARQCRRWLHEDGLHRPIFWASLPTGVVALGTLGERAVVYYCGDDFSSLAGVDHAPVMAMEQQLVDRADLIIAASEHLARRFPQNKTLYLPHGVDFELFATPAARPDDLPESGPIAGFYGSIADWVDVSMLADAAKERPNWHFVLIGSVETDISELEGLPNLHFLGKRPHHDLPGYVQHFHASLLPFRDTDQIRHCNPLKLREYLAAGSPIVSTRFPAMEPYAHLLTVIEPGSRLAPALDTARADSARNAIRRDAVRNEGWDNRADEIRAALERL